MAEPGSTFKVRMLPYTYEEAHSGQIQCSQKTIIQQGERQWHVRVTCSELSGLRKKSERRDALREIIKATDYASLSLLEDTVTKIHITRCPSLPPSEPNLYQYETSEDQQRLQYPFSSLYTIEDGLVQIRFPSLPSFACNPIPAIAVEKVQVLDDINGQVFRVQVAQEDAEFIHKTVERPFYEPLDTVAFENEMQTALLLRDIPNIGQIVGVTVGKSIYLTSKDREAPDMIHGMLFKYYPGGTINQPRHINQEPESWRKWPLQIARALREIHKRELVHMDLKPSNIVLDTEDNAVIVDFGGQQVTYDWLAPELREKEEVFMCPLEQKVRGELWTLGKLFYEIIINHQNHTGTLEINRLNSLATQLMHDDPRSRISLDQVISELERRENDELITAS